MALSKRERYIAIAVGGAIGLFALDRVLLQPLVNEKIVIGGQIDAAQKQLKDANDLFSKRKVNNARWNSMINSGLKGGASEAESQMLNNIVEWADEADVSLAALRPERTVKEKEFTRSTFRANVTGNMSQVGRFLHQIQSAQIPVKVTDLQIDSKKEGADDLAVAIGIGTVYFIPEPPKATAQAGGAREGQP